MLIGGQLVQSASGEIIDSVNPATGNIIGHIPVAGKSDVDEAVSAGIIAQAGWARTDMQERAELLRNIARNVRQRAEEILQIEVRDTGNTVSKLRGDITTGINFLEYFAGLGLELKGISVPASQNNLHFTLREPYGVVGRIIPFNHPFMFALAKMGAPLMAGNSLVIKPPESSSLSAGILAEICRDIVPAGLVNIVTGTGSVTGDALARHPQVRRLGFIGSVPTGLAIQRAAAEVAVKHISLELGGKNPMIVFPDINPDVAATAAVAAMNFSWQGQSCGSCSRLLLHESIHDEVLDKIIDKVRNLVVGDPLDPVTQMGPLNSLMQRKKMECYVRNAHKEGAMLMIGGKRPSGAMFDKGYWYLPTVFSGVTAQMQIGREEVFGPLLSVMRWQNMDDLLRVANSTEYGLTAAVWTNDLKAAIHVIRHIRAGYIWVNNFSAHYLGTPFGGVGNSGLDREECLDELYSYSQIKTVHIAL